MVGPNGWKRKCGNKQGGTRALKSGHFSRRLPFLAAFFVIVISMFTVLAANYAAAENGLELTAEERAFMEAHPVIYIGVDPGFVPYEFIDEDGVYKGIAADYLDYISKKTGLIFKLVEGLSWTEVYNKALAGEIDMLPAIGKTSEREKYFLFSKPYYNFQRVIAVQDTNTGISGIDDLYGLTVAVQRNSSHHSYLLSYPDIHLSLYDSAEAALAAVATGTEKAFVGNLAATNYIIRTTGLTNLRLISFEPEKQQTIHFAVKRDWPELVSILNKTMNSMTESERLAILSRWVELDTRIDYKPVARILLVIGALVAVVLSVSFFWIVRLQKEVHSRKQIQAALEKAKLEADEANQFKSSFMARMSHEIRTPLNSIMGISYLLGKTDLSLTQKMYLDRIVQAANSMIGIINDILDYTKIEAGKIELEEASFSLDQVIQNVVNIVSYKIDEKGIGFRVAKDPAVPNWFLGDAKRIEQILLNVLNNAIKFTGSGEVSLDIRFMAKAREKYHITFIIKDTGIGMTEEHVARLFEPFVQGDSSISRRFGGSGLGLSIVKNLVDMMDGEIRVFSTPGEGSTFLINLSLAVDKEKESVYVRALARDQFRNIRTLILEKSGANINLIGSYLSSLGMYCELTSSETSAVSMLEAANGIKGTFAKPFDLFIVDYDTPVEGGFNFIEKLRQNSKITIMPKIIMLFPMMRYDLFEKINDYGISMGVGKPVMPSILLNGIVEIFNLKAVSRAKSSGNGESLAVKPLDKSYNVLLAEDNRTNQLIVKSILEQVGINTIIANDGKEAVELFEEQGESIDLILMDLHMPVMDGYEAAERIRELSPNVPIVAMTADVIMGVREKCKQRGIEHYISKPFNPEHLVKTVEDILLKAGPGSSRDETVLDRQLGLKNMGGNEELYLHALMEYYRENLDTSERLEAAVREKRYAEAAQIVHKVKGSSGSIGAGPLHDVATLLQKALQEKKDDEILPLQKRFSELIGKLLEEIKLIQGNPERNTS